MTVLRPCWPFCAGVDVLCLLVLMANPSSLGTFDFRHIYNIIYYTKLLLYIFVDHFCDVNMWWRAHQQELLPTTPLLATKEIPLTLVITLILTLPLTTTMLARPLPRAVRLSP